MITIHLIILVLAFCLALLAAVGIPQPAPPNPPYRFHLGWMAIALFILDFIIK